MIHRKTDPVLTGLCVAAMVALLWVAPSCGNGRGNTVPLDVPRGYVATLACDMEGSRIEFGPFVGYYFRPESPEDLTRLQFVCFNEQSFYTRDLPENALLFEGEAVFTRLPHVDHAMPRKNRINPVFFKDAPKEWLNTRPAPQDEFVHFHSCHDAGGPVPAGYWVRHVGTATFTYDMGGRVGPGSPLYHEVKPGVDKDFARIVEFDRGVD